MKVKIQEWITTTFVKSSKLNKNYSMNEVPTVGWVGSLILELAFIKAFILYVFKPTNLFTFDLHLWNLENHYGKTETLFIKGLVK